MGGEEHTTLATECVDTAVEVDEQPGHVVDGEGVLHGKEPLLIVQHQGRVLHQVSIDGEVHGLDWYEAVVEQSAVDAVCSASHDKKGKLR